mgnify:CR=1 FL=1
MDAYDHRVPLLRPGWLVFALFALNPLWWALGFGDLSWCLAAIPVWAWILTRRQFVMPPSVGLFLCFITWTLVTVTQLDRGSRLFAFSFRFLSLCTAAGLAIYVYNERRVTRLQLARWISWFWIAAMIGGYLGLALPNGRINTTLASVLLPKSIASNDLVQNMVRPGFAQQQDQWGVAAVRPKTLFPFTNEWGGNLALLTPFFVAAWLTNGSKRRRTVGWLLAAAAVIPAIKSVNRGLWISIAVLCAVVGLRSLYRGRPAVLGAMFVVSLIGAAAIFLSPLRATIVERLASERSTDTRAGIYKEAFDGALQRPVFGWGGPRPSSNPYSPAIGTHGQFFLVMFAHGFVGLAIYVVWAISSVAASFRQVDDLSLIISATVLIGALQMFFYNLLPTALPIILVGLAVACRPPDGPVVADDEDWLMVHA